MIQTLTLSQTLIGAGKQAIVACFSIDMCSGQPVV